VLCVQFYNKICKSSLFISKAESQHGILQVQISWSMANGDGKVGRTVLITRMYLEVKLGLGTRRK
jgi:hypothetical protein